MYVTLISLRSISHLLYSSQLANDERVSDNSDDFEHGIRDSNTYQQFRNVDEKVVSGVRSVMGEITSEEQSVCMSSLAQA